MTLLSLIHEIIGVFASFGAQHPVHAIHGTNGYIFSHHFLVGACRIPAHLHGTFRCVASVYR